MESRQDFEFYLQEHLSDLFLLTGMAIGRFLPPPIPLQDGEFDYTPVIECLRKVEKRCVEEDSIRQMPGWIAMNHLLDYTHLVE